MQRTRLEALDVLGDDGSDSGIDGHTYSEAACENLL